MTSIEKKKCCESCIQPLPPQEELQVTICYKTSRGVKKMETWVLCCDCHDLIYEGCHPNMEVVTME